MQMLGLIRKDILEVILVRVVSGMMSLCLSVSLCARVHEYSEWSGCALAGHGLLGNDDPAAAGEPRRGERAHQGASCRPDAAAQTMRLLLDPLTASGSKLPAKK